jgi:small subunit ribosomal protein S15
MRSIRFGFTMKSSLANATRGSQFSPLITRSFSEVHEGVFIPKFQVPVSDTVAPVISLATANSKDLLRYNKSIAVQKYKYHETDTGSAPVQIAVMTEKLMNLARHALQHKKDKSSMRGYQILLARRKKMMSYLKRTNIELFKETIVKVGLEKEAQHVKA